MNPCYLWAEKQDTRRVPQITYDCCWFNEIMTPKTIALSAISVIEKRKCLSNMTQFPLNENGTRPSIMT